MVRVVWEVGVVVVSAILVFPKTMVPPNHPFYQGFHYKPSILGYPYFGNIHIELFDC